MLRSRPQFEFGTKAETLARLTGVLTLSSVPAMYCFTVAAWRDDSRAVCAKVHELFGAARVVVRSSASGEDGAKTSMAGKFMSVLGVAAGENDALERAVLQVIASYNAASAEVLQEQLLVQYMVEDVSLSGVLFTQDLNTGAPYYVINYDDESGKTDTVTAGGEYSNRTLLVHRDAIGELRSERFKALLTAVREIEEITASDTLDIEFALDTSNRVYVLQVRQITTSPNWNRGITLSVNHAIRRVRDFVSECMQPLPFVYGSRTVLGQMPDWNPAEMIGSAPRPLALSLYRYLITDRVWREARRMMGYFEPRGGALMVSLAGRPYIDVRMSFNSFLPAGLPESVAKKLVNAYLDHLCAHKEYHDKIEFAVAVTALDFEFSDVMRRRYPGLLTADETDAFRGALYRLTWQQLSGAVTPIEGELHKIEALGVQQRSLGAGGSCRCLFTVGALLEGCITHGTIPFSVLARQAFMGNSLLESLVARGAASEDEAFAFKASIKTVAGELVAYLYQLNTGRLSTAAFMSRYGHLRPGTYDILSLRYDQCDDLLHGADHGMQAPPAIEPFTPSPSFISNAEKLMREAGFSAGPQVLFDFVEKAVRAREYAKFVFTKSISNALEIIAAWGERVGLSRDELSYLTIYDILDSASVASGRTLEQHLRDIARAGRETHEITMALHFPHLVEGPEDISIVPLLLHRPNFVTRNKVRGRVVFLNGHDDMETDLAGKVVLIEGADPGFDWIFSRNLAGLVTKYGGMNSHMAIRCAEFKLPAAIGCGEQIFGRLVSAKTVEINCSEGHVIPLEY